ncbi:MAG: thioredoxin fold domain-containing protein [Gammaproteobacteria bacterium]|nr:thioredoxin fold domain-containing protein [Gammaproteobacteria bacterium]
MRVLSIVLSIMLSALSFTSIADETRDPYKFFFTQTLGDFSEELEIAKEDGKKGVFIFYEMDECPFCHYMKNNVLNRRSVQEYFHKDFVAFSIDIEGDVMITTFDGKEMSQKDYAFKVNKVRATPVMAFYDLQGQRIFRYTGKTRGKEEFLWMTDYISQGLYKTTKFNKYKRQRRRMKK